MSKKKSSQSETKPITPKNLSEVQNDLNGLMGILSKHLESNKNLFRLQINYDNADGFEFKSVIRSEVVNDHSLVVSQHREAFDGRISGDGFKTFDCLKLEAVETGEKNDDGWLQSYQIFDSIKRVSTDYSK